MYNLAMELLEILKVSLSSEQESVKWKKVSETLKTIVNFHTIVCYQRSKYLKKKGIAYLKQHCDYFAKKPILLLIPVPKHKAR